MHGRIKILIFVSLALLLSSCIFYRSKNAVLWTNRPEFIIYTELFNSLHDNYRIEIVYKESPKHSLLKKEGHPDIIVGENLLSSPAAKNLKNLNYLLKKKSINPNIFYSELLSHSGNSSARPVLPISFNLPLIMFRKDSKTINTKTVMDIESIMESGKAINGSNEYSSPIGFSPAWKPEFLYIIALLFNSNFHGTENGKLAWNDSNLNSSLSFIKNWINNVNGGYKNNEYFPEQYLLNPGYKLIENKEILFAYSNIRKFAATIPEKNKERLDFRWITRNNRIPVLDDVLLAGIPKRGKNPEAAAAFLKWFFKLETQELILKTIRTKRIRTFGIGQGLSSLKKVNKTIFPKFYQFFLGHIPQGKLLLTQKPLPLNWKEIKENVLIPWLIEESSDKRTGKNFSRYIENWSLLEPDIQ